MSISLYQSAVTTLTKEIGELNKKIGDEKAKEAKLIKELSSLTKSINQSKNRTTVNSKINSFQSKTKALSDVQKKIGEHQKKMSEKQKKLFQKQENLNKALKRHEDKRHNEAQKRHKEELKYQKEIATSLEQQVELYEQMEDIHLVIDVLNLPEKIKVLFFAANPTDQTQLKLDEEIRSITEKIRSSEYRDSIELISRWAVRPQDLLQSLNEEKPHIVHFSGHGSNQDELVFMDDQGNAKLVSQQAIVQLITATSENIKLVVFNTCYSKNQAEALTDSVDFAIGMNTSIGDQAARVFAASFYSALGFSHSVQKAFEQAKAALMLEGIPEETTPELFYKQGVNPNEVILVKPDLS